jgi:ribosome-binding ATPase
VIVVSLSIGIVGLPNSGKSTLFNALTKGSAKVSNHPFTTIDPNIGNVKIPEDRLAPLEKIYGAKRQVPAEIAFYDIAGLIEGSSRGEGMGNQFLSHIRQTDALIIVLRCFDDPGSSGVIDPLGDLGILLTELVLADLEVVENGLEKREKVYKLGEKSHREEIDILKKVALVLRDGKPAIDAPVTVDEWERIKSFSLLTAKPVLYVANLAEDNRDPGSIIGTIRKALPHENAEIMTLSARVEAELMELPEEEALLFAEELGIQGRALDRLIVSCRSLLRLVTFFTGNEKEVRAWTISDGTTALKAAGGIHSDMERGFIKAEIITCDELIRIGTLGTARERGIMRIEGKDYILKEGDVVYFRFNV